LDTALSALILASVSAGEMPATMRLYVPGREVAFGRRDTVTPEYPLAVAAARDAGFAAVERLAGGRAAVFTEHTIAFALAVPDRDPRTTIYPRFQEMSDLIVASFRRLGITAGIGEVSGEYCPGEYSVHHENRIKLMGIGQRLTKHAAHVGGVISVSRTKLLLSALIPVYRALDIEWRPATTGSLADINAGIGNDDVIAALKAELNARFEVTRGRISDDLVVEARRLAGQYLPDDLD
jgi:lipoate-protein ligase A